MNTSVAALPQLFTAERQCRRSADEGRLDLVAKKGQTPLEMSGAYHRNRRWVVLGVLTIPVAAFAKRAQPTGTALTLSNRRGVTIRPSPEQPDAPLLWVALPGTGDDRCAVIEMPEHSWGRPRGTTPWRAVHGHH